MDQKIKLWRYHQRSGFWVYERSCIKAEADAWLKRFSSDEPLATFCLSAKKPSRSPREK